NRRLAHEMARLGADEWEVTALAPGAIRPGTSDIPPKVFRCPIRRFVDMVRPVKYPRALPVGPIEEEKNRNDYRRPSASASRRKEVFPRRHRKAHWPSPLLHLPRRERPHGSGDRDAGENGPGAGGSTLSTLLRRRGTA